MSQPDDRPNDAAVLDAATRLEQSMQGFREDIGSLHTYGRRNRHYIWGLAISLILDLLLSGVVAVVAAQASNASSLANRNAQTQRATCEATNDARAANRSLWGYIIAAASTPEQTPEQRKQVDDLAVFVSQVFAPRDCAHLDRPAVVPTIPPPR